MNQNEVSIIVVTYNSSWSKTQLTLLSCLKQKNVKIEIIIADDHSEDNHFDRLKLFFEKNNFTNYTLVGSDENHGTCINFYNGLLKAKYMYVKSISPGDMLHNSDTLLKWTTFMELNNVKASFCRNVFYKIEKGELQPFLHATYPSYLDCYLNDHYNFNRCRFFDIVMRDTNVGVNYLIERETFLYYLKMLVDYGVVYCEDYLRWPMYWDGIGMRLFDEIGTWYEHDVDGISSSARYSAWQERFHQDEMNTNRILIERHPKGFFLRKLVLLYKTRRTKNVILKRVGKVLLYPESVFWWFKKRSHRSFSSTTPDRTFVLTIMSEIELDD